MGGAEALVLGHEGSSGGCLGGLRWQHRIEDGCGAAVRLPCPDCESLIILDDHVRTLSTTIGTGNQADLSALEAGSD